VLICFVIALALVFNHVESIQQRTLAELKNYERSLLELSIVLSQGCSSLRDCCNTLLKKATGEREAILQTVLALEELRFAGLPVADSLGCFLEQIGSAMRFLKKRHQLWLVFRVRLLLGVGLAIFFRVVVFRRYHFLSALDLFVVAVAGLQVACASWVFVSSLPKAWVWQQGLKKVAISWLCGHVSGNVSGAADPKLLGESARELAVLSKKELLEGVSMLRTKRLVLERHAHDLLDQATGKLQNREDALPLFELWGIGIPVALILIFPVMECFK
jgi:hypothetical protein